MGNKQSKKYVDLSETNRPGDSQHYDEPSPSTHLSFPPKRNVAVCAIDFGTSYSGFAFSYLTEGAVDANKIYLNRNWPGSIQHTSAKTPTCLMTGHQDQFCYFGYEAEEEYQRVDEKDKGTYHLFRHFKMVLSEKKGIPNEYEIEAVDSKFRMKAIDIFTMAIKYMKDQFLQRLQDQMTSEVDVKLITWVITVPAIWSDGAKYFMRNAAFKAGCIEDISSTNLAIALEPEAASIMGRDLPVNAFSLNRLADGFILPESTEFMTVDAGGGTTDITFHKIVEKHHLQEIFLPSGLSFGSTRIDQNFKGLLCDTFGESFMKKFQEDNPSDFLRLMMKFEIAKIQYAGKKPVQIELPFTLAKMIPDGQIATSSLLVSGGLMKLSQDGFSKLIDPVVSEMAAHVKTLLEHGSLQNISLVLLVGGLGSSILLKSELKRVIPSKVKIISPEEPALIVLEGAVIFGKNREAIASRIMRHTYGVAMEPKFKGGVHKSDKKVIRSGVAYCADVFKPYVYRGELMKSGERKTEKFFPRIPNQPCMTFDIYSTDKTKEELDQVEYPDSPHFAEVESISVKMPKELGSMDREVRTDCFLGGTEVNVSLW